MGLLFNKNTSSEVNNLDNLKSFNEDLYNSLVTEAQSGLLTQVDELKSELAKRDEQAKIRAYGAKLGLGDVAEECISNGLDYTQSIEKLIDSSSEKNDENLQSFEKSSSDEIGDSAGEDEDNDSPNTFASAISLVSERDGITKREASKVAKVEFPELFKKIYN